LIAFCQPKQVSRLAAEDAAVDRLMGEAQHLLKPRSALREPALVARVEAANGRSLSALAQCFRSYRRLSRIFA